MISPQTLTEDAERLVARRAQLLQELSDIEGKLASIDPASPLTQNGQSLDADDAAGPPVRVENTRQVLISMLHKGRMYHIRAFSSPGGWGGAVAVHGSFGTITGFQPFNPPRTFRSKQEVVSAFTAATNEWIDRQLANEPTPHCGS